MLFSPVIIGEGPFQFALHMGVTTTMLKHRTAWLILFLLLSTLTSPSAWAWFGRDKQPTGFPNTLSKNVACENQMVPGGQCRKNLSAKAKDILGKPFAAYSEHKRRRQYEQYLDSIRLF